MWTRKKSRFGLRLRQGFHHRAKAPQRPARKQSVLRGADQTHRYVVRWMAVYRKLHVRRLRAAGQQPTRSEEHTSELQSHLNLVCRLLLEKKKKQNKRIIKK